MSTVLVHDTRLKGPTPTAMADVCIEVGKHSPINGLVGDISNASNSTISRLLIMCHGYESSEVSQACPPTLGFGLQLCMESLTLRNVDVLAPLYGAIENIILYSCGPANTGVGAAGTPGDGRRFCQEMAAYTQANVYASDATQKYNNLKYDPSQMVCEVIPIDFGNWEGDVYLFTPDGGISVIESNPV